MDPRLKLSEVAIYSVRLSKSAAPCLIFALACVAGGIRERTSERRSRHTRELTNRRLLHDGAVRLREMLTAHAFLSTCQLRAKVDDVGESDLPASWKQEDVKLVFKVFS